MHVNTNLVFKLSQYSVTSMYNAIKYNAKSSITQSSITQSSIKQSSINILSICTSKQVVEHVSPPRVKTSMKRVGAMTHLKLM